MAINVSLPNNWHPRPDQMELWTYLENGGKRADVVAHRRWGKDDVSLHWTACAMHEKVGVYWHMLPEAAQARKAIWDAVNPRTGKRRIDEAFPKELRATTRDQEMFIRFKNGSTWQVLGSDNYNSFVGSPPVGVVFSEWSLAKPDGWNYCRPILLENGGWAIFIWTPRGRNHATRAFEAREKDPEWYTKRMPAGKRKDGKIIAVTPVFNSEQLEKEREELINESGSLQVGDAMFGTEYLVDFDAPVPGSYYAEQMSIADQEGRIGTVPYDPRYPVDSMWDLGIDDYTSIWFGQRISETRFNLIAHYETSDLGLDAIYKQAFIDLPREKRWAMPPRNAWKFHYLPHDVVVRELGAGGRSRRETLKLLGLSPIRVGVQNDPEERVNAVRRMLAYCHFDKENCQTGIDHLKQYSKRWNQSLGQFVGPLHNEHSHAADALGEGAVNMRFPKAKIERVDPPQDRYKRSPTFGTRSIIAKKRNWKVA